MAKKITLKVLEERINLATRQLNFNSRMLESIGVAFSEYVRFKGDEQDFKNHLENSKNLHKLTKEDVNSRKKGCFVSDNELSTKKVRKESDGKK